MYKFFIKNNNFKKKIINLTTILIKGISPYPPTIIKIATKIVKIVEETYFWIYPNPTKIKKYIKIIKTNTPYAMTFYLNVSFSLLIF